MVCKKKPGFFLGSNAFLFFGGFSGNFLESEGGEVFFRIQCKIQKIDEIFVDLSAYHSLPFVPEQFEDGFQGAPIGPGNSAAFALTYFNNRKASIYGGSNEIQRNIICKAVLGL